MTNDQLILAWKESQKELARIKKEEMELRNKVIAVIFNPSPDAEGTQNFDLGNNYKLKAVFKQSYSLQNKDGQLDKAIARMEKLGDEAEYIIDRLIKWKPELSISEYKNLPNAYCKILESALTIKPSAPSLELVEPK